MKILIARATIKTATGRDYTLPIGRKRRRLKLRACLQMLAIGNQGTLFAIRSIMSSLDHGEIIRSTDGGLTWTQATDGAVLMAVDPQDENTLYGNTAGGLFKTTDGGVNWTPANSGLPAAAFLVIDPRNSDTLYAGTGNRIFKSTDGAANWLEASFGLPPAPPPGDGFLRLRSLAINPRNPETVYTVIYRLTGPPTTSSYEFFLSTSTDGAASRTTSGDPLLASADLMTIIPGPQDARTLYLGTSSGILKTTDGVAHWNFSNSGLRAASVEQVVIDTQTAGTMFALDSSITGIATGCSRAPMEAPVGLSRTPGCRWASSALTAWRRLLSTSKRCMSWGIIILTVRGFSRAKMREETGRRSGIPHLQRWR